MFHAFLKKRGHGIKLSMVHGAWYLVPGSIPSDSMNLVSVTLLQFDDNGFETVQMFLSWSEDVHVIWI